MTKIHLSASFRNVPRTPCTRTSDTCIHWVQATELAVKNFRRVPFFGATFLRASKKGDEKKWKLIEAVGLRFA